MSYMKEKVSYLRGLADGLNVQDEATAKLFGAMIEAMGAMADAIDENEVSLAELDECVDDLYDSLDEIEDEIDLCCGDCDCFDDDDDDDDDDEDDDDDDFVEMACPHCGETIFFDESMLTNAKSLICPNCNGDVIGDCEEEEEEQDD